MSGDPQEACGYLTHQRATSPHRVAFFGDTDSLRCSPIQLQHVRGDSLPWEGGALASILPDIQGLAYHSRDSLVRPRDYPLGEHAV